MLVITRNVREHIRVKTMSGETITISISKIKGKQVRIGVDADSDVKIYRAERETEEGFKLDDIKTWRVDNKSEIVQ